MFDWDKWQEILATMQKNKLRTFLTAFGVFWGIFMLVLLLGAGKGLQNGVEKDFGSQAIKSLWFWQGRTTMPYKGFKPGREVIFNEADFEALQKEIPGVYFVAKRSRLTGEYTVNYKDKNGGFQVFASNGEFFKLNGEAFTQGRSLNLFDIAEGRKVTVIGDRARKILFGDSTNCLGEYINIKGIYFKVVGVFKIEGQSGDGRREERIYIPFSTYRKVFSPQDRIELMGLVVKEEANSKEVEQKAREVIAKKHNFDVADVQALGINNNDDNYQQTMGLFAGIRTFVWIVGIGTLIAGIVGVSNIMLIIVKERTKEIGVRKALGATPFSIVSQILQESIVITSLSGYFGLLFGVAILDGLSYLINSTGAEMPFFNNPEVDFGVAFSAIIVLVVAGALAGLFPALRAANIKPIEALRAD